MVRISQDELEHFAPPTKKKKKKWYIYKFPNLIG